MLQFSSNYKHPFQEGSGRGMKEILDLETIIAKNWRSINCQQVACAARDHLVAT
jgi:fido (protein-threonine AMPylation protein)